MAIIEAFGKAGIAIPSGQSEIAIRKPDWLREMIFEGASIAVGRGAADGGKIPAEVAAASAAASASEPTK